MTIQSRRQLSIIHAGRTAGGRSLALAEAALAGARSCADEVETRLLAALDADLADLLAAQAVLFVTPEKFGYMAGTLKDFFDRTFYPAQGKVEGLPYAIMVSAGNDGRGAVTAIERIARGYPLKPVAEPLIVRGEPSEADLAAARELGEALAAGVAYGVF
ncbi:NAD(P)H-dependent oxidoreductase [Chitinimonas koreensis]|uniref:NAD(P)H-dependent oxidoreductase n=1 Tax=Chitinimonas koreensis TaxID=356302 RepID=UPI00041BD7A5|nr:NAD(P)H-dependent oxidoreductase [Chitinimonas koreensis]QNM97597.1 NAD(P)H-dependent oxidoreductase [Chitinimonas koreensis]